MLEEGLAQDQVALFRRQGFLAIEDLASPQEIAELADIYDRLFGARAGWDQGDYFDLAAAERPDQPILTPQLLRLSRYEPRLLQSPVLRRGLAVARSILGPAARLEVDHGIVKPPGTDAVVAWHQDEAFWDGRYDHDGLSIWIPLEDAHEGNGCMQVVPGSHQGRVRAHRTIGGDPEAHGLEIPRFRPAATQSCPVRLGGAVVHHARTIHGSGPNRTSAPRRAYVLVFEGRKRRRLIPRPQHWRLTQHSARAARAREAERTPEA